MARRLLLAFPALATAHLAALSLRLLPARPDWIWGLAVMPVTALVVGPRTWSVVVGALVELTTLVPLHGFVTLLRAARLEGG